MIKPTAARARGPGRLFKLRSGDADVWVLDYTAADGRRARKRLSTDRKVAERLRNEILRKRDLQSAGLGVTGGQDRLLTELRDLYLQDLRLRSSAGHLANKTGRLNRALAGVRAQRVRDLTPADAVALQGALARAGLSNTTINMQVGALQTLLRWALRMRLIEESPIESIRPLPSNEKTLVHRRRALSEDEIARLVQVAGAEDAMLGSVSRQVPQAAFWHAAVATGLRYSELRLLTWGAIDFDGAMLTVRGEHAKSGKSRSIPIHRDLLHTLAGLHRFHERLFGREVRDADWVFLAPRGAPWLPCSNNANRLLLRLLEAARIDRFDEAGRKIDIHALRHTFCSRLARTGASVTHAQRLMGHADVRLTSRVYTHLDAEQTRGAIDALPSVSEPKHVTLVHLAGGAQPEPTASSAHGAACIP